MDDRWTRVRLVVWSIVNGVAAFFIASFLLFVGGVILLMALQIDFILASQLVFLLLISSVVGLILGIVAGVKYYRQKGKSQ